MSVVLNVPQRAGGILRRLAEVRCRDKRLINRAVAEALGGIAWIGALRYGRPGHAAMALVRAVRIKFYQGKFNCIYICEITLAHSLRIYC